jgi:hypothetical protein
MAEGNVYNHPAASKRHSSSVDSGGDGPHDGDMRERVASLEGRLDTLIPTLATKGDMGELRADIKAWMLGTVLVLIVGLASIIFAMTGSINSQLTALKPSPPAQNLTQPIIIQVPYPATASYDGRDQGTRNDAKKPDTNSKWDGKEQKN